ncbi:MAG TPA: hypothetical protein VFZ62_01310 [Candidatus Saccharimonadales bacterium]
MSVREFRVETPSTSQEIRAAAGKIFATGKGTLTLVGVEIGNELAERRGTVEHRTFELEILSLEPGTDSFSIEAQDISPEGPKQWLKVYQTEDREVHIQVAE